MGAELEDQSQIELTREEMLRPCCVYRDSADHLILILKRKGMPQTVSHSCPQCLKPQLFKITTEPDLIDIIDRSDHSYGISPRLAEKESRGEDTFFHQCYGCGKRQLFQIDWQTRERELRAMRIDLATPISK